MQHREAFLEYLQATGPVVDQVKFACGFEVSTLGALVHSKMFLAATLLVWIEYIHDTVERRLLLRGKLLRLGAHGYSRVGFVARLDLLQTIGPVARQMHVVLVYNQSALGTRTILHFLGCFILIFFLW